MYVPVYFFQINDRILERMSLKVLFQRSLMWHLFIIEEICMLWIERIVEKLLTFRRR